MLLTHRPRCNEYLLNLRFLTGAAAVLLSAATAHAADELVYAAAARGIYGYRFDPHNARLKSLGLLADFENPSLLVAHSDHRFLYAGNPAGKVASFLIDPKSGKLSQVNQVGWYANPPCDLTLDRSGRWLAAAGAAGIAIFPLRKDGGLGEARTRASSASSIAFSPDNHFLLAGSDSGIAVYRFDVETGALTAAIPQSVKVAADGLVFHKTGRVVYAIDHFGLNVTALHYDPSSASIEPFQTLALNVPAPVKAAPRAGLAINAGGTVVYLSHSNSNDVAILPVDPARLTLSVLELTPLVGQKPTALELDPAGGYLLVASEDSKSLTVYSVHPHTGQLRPAGRPTPEIEHPTAVVIVPVE